MPVQFPTVTVPQQQGTDLSSSYLQGRQAAQQQATAQQQLAQQQFANQLKTQELYGPGAQLQQQAVQAKIDADFQRLSTLLSQKKVADYELTQKRRASDALDTFAASDLPVSLKSQGVDSDEWSVYQKMVGARQITEAFNFLESSKDKEVTPDAKVRQAGAYATAKIEGEGGTVDKESPDYQRHFANYLAGITRETRPEIIKLAEHQARSMGYESGSGEFNEIVRGIVSRFVAKQVAEKGWDGYQPAYVIWNNGLVTTFNRKNEKEVADAKDSILKGGKYEGGVITSQLPTGAASIAEMTGRLSRKTISGYQQELFSVDQSIGILDEVLNAARNRGYTAGLVGSAARAGQQIIQVASDIGGLMDAGWARSMAQNTKQEVGQWKDNEGRRVVEASILEDLFDPALSVTELHEHTMGIRLARWRQPSGRILKDAIDKAMNDVKITGAFSRRDVIARYEWMRHHFADRAVHLVSSLEERDLPPGFTKADGDPKRNKWVRSAQSALPAAPAAAAVPDDANVTRTVVLDASAVIISDSAAAPAAAAPAAAAAAVPAAAAAVPAAPAAEPDEYSIWVKTIQTWKAAGVDVEGRLQTYLNAAKETGDADMIPMIEELLRQFRSGEL